MPQRRKLTDDELAQLARRLEADPDAQRIAAAVRQDVSEFVRQVLYFVQNPEAGPKVHLVDDAVLKKNGFNPASADQVKSFVARVVRDHQVAGATRRAVSSFEGAPPKKPVF